MFNLIHNFVAFILLISLQSAALAANARAESRHVELADQMKWSANHNAWNGVEQIFQEMLKLERKGVQLTYMDLWVAADAAEALGHINDFSERLQRAREIEPTIEVRNKLIQIQQQCSSVSIGVARSYAGDYTLQHDMSFTSLQRAAFTEAAAAVAATRSYTGLLPVGTYSIGDKVFSVTKLHEEVVTIWVGEEKHSEPTVGPFQGVTLSPFLAGFNSLYAVAVDLPLRQLPSRYGYSAVQAVAIASVPYEYYSETIGLQVSIARRIHREGLWGVLGSGAMGGTTTFWMSCEQTDQDEVVCGGSADGFFARITAPLLMAPVLRFGWASSVGRFWTGADIFLVNTIFAWGWDEKTINVVTSDGAEQQMRLNADELTFSYWGLAGRVWLKF